MLLPDIPPFFSWSLKHILRWSILFWWGIILEFWRFIMVTPGCQFLTQAATYLRIDNRKHQAWCIFCGLSYIRLGWDKLAILPTSQHCWWLIRAIYVVDGRFLSHFLAVWGTVHIQVNSCAEGTEKCAEDLCGGSSCVERHSHLWKTCRALFTCGGSSCVEGTFTCGNCAGDYWHVGEVCVWRGHSHMWKMYRGYSHVGKHAGNYSHVGKAHMSRGHHICEKHVWIICAKTCAEVVCQKTCLKTCLKNVWKMCRGLFTCGGSSRVERTSHQSEIPHSLIFKLFNFS